MQNCMSVAVSYKSYVHLLVLPVKDHLSVLAKPHIRSIRGIYRHWLGKISSRFEDTGSSTHMYLYWRRVCTDMYIEVLPWKLF